MGKSIAKRLFRIPRLHLRHPPGTAPGTVIADPHALPPVINVLAYNNDRITEAQNVSVEQLADFLRDWPVVWIDVQGLGDAKIITALGEQFNLHRLALEDVVNVHQRAKFEPYAEHAFCVARMIRMDDAFINEQLSLFFGQGFLLTFQEQPGDVFEPVRTRLRKHRGRIRQGGADYLAYALLDAVVDAYFPVLETIGRELEDLEVAVLESPGASTVETIHELKRHLLALRRATWPMRETINGMMRDDSQFVADETRLYLRDCYDHVIQVMDMLETYRELASGLMDLYLSSISQRTNDIMKVLTIFAAIFIPLTFIAGLYGMNFEHMPELQWPWAYPAALAVMAGTAIVLLLFFRHKGWLGDGTPHRQSSTRHERSQSTSGQHHE